MGWGTGNLGGGSGGLNFRIVGGTSEPSNPRENLIWVNTDVKITSWVFSANEPENPESGTVWISTGSSSTVAFNALKKNGIHVYPISAKQYIAGGSASILGEGLLGEMVLGSTTSTDSQWVDVTAKSYQNGEWCDWWNGQLYEPGNTYDNITGGWANWFSSGGSFVVGSDSLDFNYSDSGGGNGTPLATRNKIDITAYTKLSAKLSDFTTSNNGSLWLGVTEGTFDNNNDLSNGFTAHTTVTSGDSVSVDISTLSGEYYVCLFVKAGYTSGKTHKASGSVTEVKLS